MSCTESETGKVLETPSPVYEPTDAMSETTLPQAKASPSTSSLSKKYASIILSLDLFLGEAMKVVRPKQEDTDVKPKEKGTTAQRLAHFLDNYYFRLSIWSNDVISIDPFKEISITDVLDLIETSQDPIRKGLAQSLTCVNEVLRRLLPKYYQTARYIYLPLPIRALP